LSRQDLTGMGMAKTETAATPVENPDAMLWQKLKDLPQPELEKILPTVMPAATLDSLLQQRNEAQAKLVQLLSDYSPANYVVEKQKALLNEVNRQIGDKTSGMMQALKLRAELPASPQAATAARQQQRDLLAKQIALAEQDLAEKQKLVQVGQATPADSRAAEREVLRLKQQLAALDAGKAELLDLSVPASSEEDQEIRRIQEMIQNSPDLINAPDDHGHTPLEKAAINGWLKVGAFLLDHGADVNAGKVSALNQAANAGNRAMVEFLLSRGADINTKAWQGKTPLHTAVELGYPAVTEVLLANKADVNAADDFGNTPLVPAAEKKQIKILQALLAAGANPNLENNNGQTPFSFAAASGSPELVKMFLAAKADPNGGRLDAPLLAAIHAGDAVSVELLLQAGANPNAKGEDDWQPSVLGSFGRPVGRGSETPIHLAVSSGQLPMVKLLLKFRADPNDSQTDGQPVLVHAVSDTNLLAALLDAGGKANARRWDGWTLLDSAVAETNLTAVQLLLKFKADPNDSQIDGRPVLFRALSDTNLLETLLDAGANIDPVTKDETEWTPLGAAAYLNNAPVVAILLKHGANPNVRNRNGVTLLHWAADGRADRRVFELLLDAKADPNIRNNSGVTPLDLAQGGKRRGSPSIGTLVLGNQPGAQPLSYQWNFNQPNSSGGQATTTTNTITVADLLRQHGAVDELPDFTRIRITRQGLSQPLEVFHRASTLTNQFTLLETVMRFYSFSPGFIPGQGNQDAWIVLPFPDFGRIIIRRPSQKTGGKEQEIKVSLLNNSNVVDCAKDVPVQFGDVIEIPESVHALNAGMPNPVREMETFTTLQSGNFAERLQALTAESAPNVSPYRTAYRTAAQCLQKSVQLVVAGETTSFKVNSWKEGFLSQALGKTEARSVLRSSSDLSRVKVTRKTGKSAKPAVFTVDVSDGSQRNDDLWLQDGDVIEVPEK